ncbi:MAG TPA: hypothetical protein VKV04_08820 [Verrucomicrobiae bacterium]|nr:hypothetical protein [Verrucomicrobiae bacterium]
MKKLLFAIVLLTATGSVAVCVAIQRHATAALRDRADSAAAQAQTIADLDAQNERLSQIIDKLKNTRSLSHDELTELLKLRSNIGQARQLVAATPGLQATNTMLRKAETTRQEHLAQAQAATNYWAKDQLAYAGFATPDNALKTILSVMTSSNLNLNAFLSYATPESLADMQREWKQKGMSPDQIQAEMKAMAGSLTSGSEGFHIVNEQSPAPDLAVIDLSFDGEDAVRTFVMQQIDGQWKLNDMLVAGQSEKLRSSSGGGEIVVRSPISH